jgi:hypothetical protein
MRWMSAALASILLSSAGLSAGHIHYFGKDRQYFGRFDITEFVDKFRDNQDSVFARYQQAWQVSRIADKQNTFILESTNTEVTSHVIVQFAQPVNGSAIATLTTRNNTDQEVLTDATLLFEDSDDLTPYIYSDGGKNTSYYLKFVQGFLVYVLSQQFNIQNPADAAPQQS